MKLPPYFLVCDVESVGLHGEAFAVGAVVIDTRTGEERASLLLWTHPRAVRGRPADYEWVEKNVLPSLSIPYLDTPREVRQGFWDFWLWWRAQSFLAADVPWPVEARFLAACVDDVAPASNWHGPYPIVDVASVRLAAGLDPLGIEERRPDELPAHNPLADARQSARLLMEALRLREIGGGR
jgi:hypothetical protein